MMMSKMMVLLIADRERDPQTGAISAPLTPNRLAPHDANRVAFSAGLEPACPQGSSMRTSSRP